MSFLWVLVLLVIPSSSCSDAALLQGQGSVHLSVRCASGRGGAVVSSPWCRAVRRRGGHAVPVTGRVGTWLLQVLGAASAGSPLGSLWELAPELCCGQAGHAAIQPEQGATNAEECGRGSPPRRGRSSGRGDGAAPCCTAIRNMSGCQQPRRQLRDLAEGVPVSRFSSASHLSEPSVAVCPAVGLPGGAPWLRPLSHGTGGTSPTSLILQGSKTEPIRAVTPRPAQPADRAGVAPRPGRICKAFILQSSVTGAALQLLLSSGLCASGSPLAARWEIPSGLPKTPGVPETGPEIQADSGCQAVRNSSCESRCRGACWWWGAHPAHDAGR